MKLVVNSSTTILLARANLLEIADEHFEEVAMSGEVYRETIEEPKKLGYEDATMIEREVKKGKIKVKSCRGGSMVKKLMRDFNMMKGEAETLVLAIEEKADLIATDDYQCIKAAKMLELPFTQAIALIVTLYENKKIEKNKALEVIEKLKEYGWYADWIIEDAKNKVR